MMYPANPGYAMAPFPAVGPVAGPVQAGGGIGSVQTVTPAGHGALPQMVVVPVSGGMGNQPQPQFVQVPTSGAMTTAYQPQQFVIPPTSGHGGYTRMSNEQV